MRSENEGSLRYIGYALVAVGMACISFTLTIPFKLIGAMVTGGILATIWGFVVFKATAECGSDVRRRLRNSLFMDSIIGGIMILVSVSVRLLLLPAEYTEWVGLMYLIAAVSLLIGLCGLLWGVLTFISPTERDMQNEATHAGNGDHALDLENPYAPPKSHS